MITERVRFLVDAEVEAQGYIEQSYEAGKVYALPAPSARRWIKRGMAEAVSGPPRADELPEVPAKKKVKAKPKAKAKAKAKPMTNYKLPGKPNRGKIAKRYDGDE